MGSEGPSTAFLGAPEYRCAVLTLDQGVGDTEIHIACEAEHPQEAPFKIQAKNPYLPREPAPLSE